MEQNLLLPGRKRVAVDSYRRWQARSVRADSLKAQALLELLISTAIFVVIVSGVIGVFLLSSKTRTTANLNLAIKALAQQLQQEVISIARRDWNAVYSTQKGAGNHYYVVNQSGTLTLTPGDETINVSGVTVTRYLYFETAYRDGNDNLANSGTEDKSSHKVIAVVSSAKGSYQSYFYVTHWTNQAAAQSSWKSGGVDGPLTEFTNTFSTSTNINYGTTSISISQQ